jgi:tetratricopeptide (TPR) repeat protein
MRKDSLKIHLLVFLVLCLSTLFAQENEDLPKYGNDSINCVRNSSLYSEFVKQKNYEDAITPWRVVFKECPKSSKNIYLNGVKIFKDYIKKEKANKEIKNKYVDTLMMIYDQRIKYFGQEGKVLGRKGYSLVSYNKEAKEEAYKYLAKSVELEGMNCEAVVVNSYFQTIVSLFKKKKAEKEQVVENYTIAMDIVEEQLKNEKNAKKIENLNKVKNNIEKLFSECGAADTDALVNLFAPKFEATPNDTLLLKKMLKLLDKAEGGGNTELFAKASEKLYELEPSAIAAYMLAKLFLKKEDYTKSTDYYLKAIEFEEDDKTKSKYYYELGVITFSKFQNSPLARTYAYKSIQFDNTFGKPYILIGNAYASSSKACGENEFERKAVYWVAVDKFAKAKAVDPSVAEEANKQIVEYTKHFPNNENAFMYGFTEGQEYTVTCWINETTKVRYK